MGIMIDGTVEELFSFSNWAHAIATIALLLCVTMTMFTMIVVYFSRYVGTRHFIRITMILLFLALSQQIMTLIYVYDDTPPILDWFATVIGILLLTGDGLAHAEMFHTFHVLTEFWSRRKVRVLQYIIVVMHVLFHVREYVHVGFLGQKIPKRINDIASFWPLWDYGIMIFPLVLSLYYTFQSVYIIYIVFKFVEHHHKESLPVTMNEKRYIMLNVTLGTLIDWIGIFFFAYGETAFGSKRAGVIFGLCSIYIHTCAIPILFHQLKKFASRKEQQHVSSEPKVKLKMLKEVTQNSSKTRNDNPTVILQ